MNRTPPIHSSDPGRPESPRKPVEPVAERSDGVGLLHVRANGPRALTEERHGLVRRERGEVELDLALNAQWLAARREQPQRGSNPGELAERTSGIREQLLEVVAEDVRATVGDARRDRLGCGGRRSQALGDRGQDEPGVAKRSERDEDGPPVGLIGEEAAKLVPAKRPSREEVQQVIARMKAERSILNPPGEKKLRIKDLIDEGRR